MHVGAVKHRVAFANYGNDAPRLEMPGNIRGRMRVETFERIAVTGAAFRQFGRHRVGERQFNHAAAQVRRDRRARRAGISGFGEIGDHIGLAQRARCFDRHQFWIARPDADANQLSRSRSRPHRPGLAKALMPAAVMALPPMRPRTMTNGTPRGSAASASLAWGARTKPTGMPRTAEGFGAPASKSSSTRNSAVGALPMAPPAPSRRSSHRSSAAAERVVPIFTAIAAVRGSLSVQITSLPT